MSEITIWYISNLQRCNFACSYCSTNQPLLQQDGKLPTWRVGEQVHEQVVAWLIAQPHKIRLRMNSIGEPFVSKSYLESVARLTRADNLAFVEILTNGSFRPEQFDAFAASCRIERLSLWMTYHHQFTTPAKLIASARHAKAAGAFVVVNVILFPDNAAGVEETMALCEEHGITLATGAGLNLNTAYPDAGFVPSLDDPTPRALEIIGLRDPLRNYHQLSETPLGKPCAAGNDFFFITEAGDVFPCHTYAIEGMAATKLGSVLDPDFALAPRRGFRPCISRARCVCPEDYQNLAEIQQRFAWPEPSFRLMVLRD